MREPRRDHYLPPTVDEATEAVLDQAVDTLANLRGMGWNGDAATSLHLLTSLIAEAQQRLPQAVADARDQDCSWAEIADLLGVTRASAWPRYAGRTNANRTLLPPD
jgi:hypothetical protein